MRCLWLSAGHAGPPRRPWSSASATATACGFPTPGSARGSTTRPKGLLLKFSGDLVYLVLIKGSNLDMPLNDGAINLTHGGLQRQRILWLREMTEEDIGRVGEKGPTIDSIEVAEFESAAESRNGSKRKRRASSSEGRPAIETVAG